MRDWRHPYGEPGSGQLQLRIDEFIHFRGRVHISGVLWHPQQRITRLDYVFPGRHSRSIARYNTPSPDAVAEYGASASDGGFSAVLWEEDPWKVQGLTLIATLANGCRESISSLASGIFRTDPFYRVFDRFWASLPSLAPGDFLEIGSRNRSGNVRRDRVPPTLRYTGFDVMAGPNVDVVGDAHELAKHFAPGSIRACASLSTFEHLAMPWRVVVQLNRVLADDALVLVTTHQTWPLHEEPWDFWRFSTHAWPTLFNRRTGFDIVDAAMGEPALILAKVVHPVVMNHPLAPANLASAVLARKVGEATVDWDATPDEFLTSDYPV